jgi:MFS family permease
VTPDRPFPFRVVAIASAATAVANIPSYLLGAMAHAIRAELGFSAAGTGLAVSAFFGASAFSAPVVSRLVQRAGPALSLRAGALLTGTTLLLIAAVARQWWVLVALLVVAGVANVIGQTAANLTLAELSTTGHDGLSFGIKQSAVPFATMAAGLAVPMVSSTVGWRWAFAIGAGGAVLVALLVSRLPRSTVGGPARSVSRPPTGRVDWTVVGLLALAVFLAAGVVLSLAVYLVEFAIGAGWSADAAGVLLAVTSVAALVTRVAAGWVVDLRTRRGSRSSPIPAAALMVLAGAGGCLLLAASEGSRLLLVLGSLLGLGIGWGFAGLVHLTVVQLNRTAAATATGLILAGVFGGGVVTPSVLGLLVDRYSYRVAWTVSAFLMLCAAGALVAAATVMRSRRRALSPVTP